MLVHTKTHTHIHTISALVFHPHVYLSGPPLVSYSTELHYLVYYQMTAHFHNHIVLILTCTHTRMHAGVIYPSYLLVLKAAVMGRRSFCDGSFGPVWGSSARRWQTRQQACSLCSVLCKLWQQQSSSDWLKPGGIWEHRAGSLQIAGRVWKVLRR